MEENNNQLAEEQIHDLLCEKIIYYLGDPDVLGNDTPHYYLEIVKSLAETYETLFGRYELKTPKNSQSRQISIG